jgi:hypothetical protein
MPDVSVLDQIHNILSQNPELFTIAGFLIGTLLGNWLAIGRDKRTEFNEIAQPIREILMKEKERKSPIVPGIGSIDADRLECAFPFWKRCGFRKAWEGYCGAKEETYQDSVGQPFYKNHENIVSHIDNVLRYTKRQ